MSERSQLVDLPRRAGVVRAPDRSLIGGLDQRIHALAVGRRDLDVDLADRRLRQAGGQLRPLRAAVLRDVDAAARAAAHLAPRCAARPARCRRGACSDPSRPSRGRSSRCCRSTNSTRCQLAPPSVVLNTPRSSCGPVMRPVGADVDDVGIGRMDDDARDAAGLLEAHVLPGLARVLRHVDAVAHDVAVADHPRLAGADPDDVRDRSARRRSRRSRRRAGRRRSARRSGRRRSTSTRRPRRSRGSRCWDRRARRRRSRCGPPRPGPCSGTSAARASWPAAAPAGRRRAGRTTATR